MQIHNEMELELIVAFSKNFVIGNENKLPWRIPEDLKRFKELTTNNIVVMGRKTFESLPSGPLKNRINIVLTKQNISDANVTDANVIDANVIYTNFEKFPSIIQNFNDKKIFIIGGSEIYNLFLPYCKIIHITYIHEDYKGDSYFPYKINYFIDNYNLSSKIENDRFSYYTFIVK
jgi:dihydrofolate reductase